MGPRDLQKYEIGNALCESCHGGNASTWIYFDVDGPLYSVCLRCAEALEAVQLA